MNRIERFKKSAFEAAFLLVAGTTLSLSPAHANSITFGQFTDAGAQNFILTNNADGSQTFSESGPVQFTYSLIAGLPTALTKPIAATLTFTANSNQNVGLTNIGGTQYAFVGGFSGSFRFTASGGPYSNANLLSGSFNGQALLIGVAGGQSGTFSDSTSARYPSEISFASDLISVARQQQNFAISLSSIFDTMANDAGFNVGGPGNTDVDNFVSSGTGTFASSAMPVVVPENASATLLIFGVSGLLLWRRGDLQR